MSYVIFGRAIKNEYLALGTFASVFGGAFLATRGGKKDAPAPTLVEQVKANVTSGNSEEEELINSIKKFVEEAEKEAKH
ncbi:uncharacterized protein ARMOST_16253 [Armillaria ostoyae]|uniref:ATP synthase subunit K, mitochondrial n=1 Tax=Armillaria ostoyae TaxID=47428 RepID=A0A284RVN6_ARMOS|nr:uncharacterized protein ARMOST_16253 [Armillaria ostoyae]